MKIDIDLDDEEKEKYGNKISEFVENELENNISKTIMAGITINESRIKKLIEETICKSLEKKIDPYIKRLLEKFEREIDILNRHLIKQNEKVLKLFTLGKNLDNVKVEFMNITVNKKQDAEVFAMKYYQDMGLKAFKFNSNIYYNIGKETYKTLKPILNRSGLKGAPDLVVCQQSDGLFFLVEVKTNGDGIRAEQMLWYKNHPSILIKILYINQIIDDSASIKSANNSEEQC